MAFTPRCGVAADIGTDHGILGCELLREGKCDTLWFTDISAESLNKARRLAEKSGFEERALFFTGDGAAVLPFPPDAAIIAGMGGHTIIHILDTGREKLKGTKLILGANTALYELRYFLAQNGYAITDEAAVREAGKFYVVFRAEEGHMDLDEDALRIGPELMKKTDTETMDYFRYRINGARIALERAGVSPNADTETLRKELERWQKLI